MKSTLFTQVPIEAVRDFWNRRPCNIRHSEKPVGTREYFDEVEARKHFVEPHIPRFAAFKRWKGKRVLEVGCGLGTATVNFARQGADVVAIDVSEASLELAKERAKVYDLEGNIKFYAGDAEQLDQFLPAQKFDLIYSFGVIHHSPNPEKILEQLKPYCHKGTTLKLMIYHRYAWKVLWAVVTQGKGQFWRLEEIVAQNSEAQSGCPITYIYSRRQAREMLANAGFRVESMRVEHIFPYRIPDYIEKRYVKEWYFRWIPAPLFRKLERVLGWHLCIAARY